MKEILLFVFSFLSTFYYSQDFKKKLGQEACKCINEMKLDNISKEKISMQLGICFLKSAAPYKDEIKKEYGIDIGTDIGKESKMEVLGEKMAMLMISECGDKFMEIMEKSGAMNETNAEESPEELMHGEITKIEKDNFVIFYIKGDNNILTKLYWISNIESNIELEKKYNELIGKKVSISYYSADIFDHRINEYRKVNVIGMLKTE